MSENQNDKKIIDRRKNLHKFTNEYIKNKSPKNESENIFKRSVEKLKSRTILLAEKVKDNDILLRHRI